MTLARRLRLTPVPSSTCWTLELGTGVKNLRSMGIVVHRMDKLFENDLEIIHLYREDSGLTPFFERYMPGLGQSHIVRY